MLRTVLLIGLVVLLFLVLVWARAFYGSRESFIKGEAFYKQGQTVRAITFFDRSIHWYTPFNPYVENSARRLWEIGEQAQRDGDDKLALIAFETIRSGFYGASHVVVPGKDWIARVDAKLHELGAAGEDVKDPHPDPFWSVVVVFSFLGWVGCAIGFILGVMGPGRDSGKRWAKGLKWTALSAAFFALWILGMFKA